MAVHGGYVRNGNRHRVALLGFRPILAGNGAGALLVGHKAVHELSVRSAAGGVLSKENGIENSLDADTVKAVAILRHVIDGINGAVQQREAAAHSLNTQKSYREAINLLLLYFKMERGLEYANVGFEDITYSNITGFLEWLSKSRGCSPATVNLRLMAIRSFTKYAGILDSGKIYMQVEVGNISIRKTPGTVVEFLTVPALETLFEQPNRFKTNGYRDFCFMRLMYDTAARCQELVDAKIHDLIIRKTHATICLAGKGNKLRIVPISPSVVELLKTYLDKAHPTEQRQSDDYLFFTTHHGCKNRMSTDAVNLFMKKYGETARRACPEVPERVHPHQLRHSRAMHLYRAGMPLVLLSEFLGHADVNTTRIYAWADTEMKRQAIQKVSKATAEDSIEPIWANDEEMIKRLYGLA